MADFGSIILRTGLKPALATPPTLFTVPSDTSFPFNGATWASQSANLADSLRASADKSTLVFRARTGENYAGAGDTSRRVRSEIYSVSQHVAVGQTIHISGIVRISGPTFAALVWDSFPQLHSDDSLGVSPSFELCPLILGSGNLRLVTQVNYRQNGGSTQYLNYYDTVNFTYDVDHAFDIQFTDAYGGNNGRMIVTLDGRNACDYTGPTGYYGAAPNSSYLKLGIHAGVDNDGQFPVGFDQITTLRNIAVTVSS